MARRRGPTAPTPAEHYQHKDATALMRPDVGMQAQYQRKAPAATYRYDSSLSPALDWDGQNSAREQGEALLAQLLDALKRVNGKTPSEETVDLLKQVRVAAMRLQAMSRPFLDWAGKAEHLSFDVPTLPLFVHERLSTKAIIEALQSHRRIQQRSLFELFADPQHSIVDQHLKAYQHRDPWVNRLILGNNLVVMNSLLHQEKMAGQVQMIYIDPPYGIKYGSNFQPFVRQRDVAHGDDEDMTREPEMVQAFRDTWVLGLHSYLTWLRDRLLVARDLLHPSGSIFVQIGDANLHHVREVMDEVFGPDNFCAAIVVQKTYGLSSPTARVDVVSTLCDFVVWYARDAERVKYHQLYTPKRIDSDAAQLLWAEEAGGKRRRLSAEEKRNLTTIPEGSRLYRLDHIIAAGYSEALSKPFVWNNRTYTVSANHHWKTTQDGLTALEKAHRLEDSAGTLRYVRYIDDFPVSPLHNIWDDTGTGQFTEERLYVVQTPAKVVARCLLMTTDPGDLVLDPTCGSGTTAYAAEQWGRRWIAIDVSRVPLALTRQRLLTATFPWYDLKDEARGPAGGFVYKRKQNRKGEEVGGIVPHVTLKSIANNETPEEAVLVDRPEVVKAITRVTGPFAVEGAIAPASDLQNGQEGEAQSVGADRGFAERMIEVLRRSPNLHLPGNRTVEFAKTRPVARGLHLAAEADLVNGHRGPVAVVFGPENGAISEKLVYDAAKEANAKNYALLVVVGFAIEPNARQLVEACEQVCGIGAVYAQATQDLIMGDLLKNMRSSQILSVCGLPEIKVERLPPASAGGPPQYQVTLLGLDVFNPVTMEVYHRAGTVVPAWFLCTDYNERCFHISQAFFPRTGAWDNLKRSLKGSFNDDVWQHLAGTISAPFEAGERGQIAVKVIDDRGNELMVVRKLDTGEEKVKAPQRATAKEKTPEPSAEPAKPGRRDPKAAPVPVASAARAIRRPKKKS